MKKITRFFCVSILVGLMSLIYNHAVFVLLDFEPTLAFESEYFTALEKHVYEFIFLKGFFVALVLMILFSAAYRSVDRHFAWAIVGFMTYAVFGFVVFSFGDMWIFGREEDASFFLTVDGVLEMIIVTVPIRLFSMTRKDALIEF